ncbi:MAG: hypothetical protein NZ455_14445 [Bacteroidia bacterium]|nr:hypothetical protein [Bacteroidia bacterium]MDW8347432.1 hypothetical protein [Bacteroidia bacterium]
MKQRFIFLFVFIFVSAYTQNVGIGTATPVNRLTINGNLSVGSGYTGLPAPANGAIIQGNTGIGTATPAHRLHVLGDIRFEGDFINQEVQGGTSSVIQAIPFNAVAAPITGTTISVTIQDGSGVNNSGVLVTGFARIVNNTTFTGTLSLAGYFLVLRRAEDPGFTIGSTICTYGSGICGLRFPNGVSSGTLSFNTSVSVTHADMSLSTGITYYYRLELYGNCVGTSGGTLDVYERNLSLVQIKR